jgi:hypothetical protein
MRVWTDDDFPMRAATGPEFTREQVLEAMHKVSSQDLRNLGIQTPVPSPTDDEARIVSLCDDRGIQPSFLEYQAYITKRVAEENS